jgi:hypothetical protein
VEGRKMFENPYYSQEMHCPYELFSLGDFVLEEEWNLECGMSFETGACAERRGFGSGGRDVPKTAPTASLSTASLSSLDLGCLEGVF